VRARNQASWALGAISEFGFGIINTATQHNPCKILCISHDLLLCFAGLGRKEGGAREEALVGTPSHQDTTSFKEEEEENPDLQRKQRAHVLVLLLAKTSICRQIYFTKIHNTCFGSDEFASSFYHYWFGGYN
jgi:hypothetical protein